MLNPWKILGSSYLKPLKLRMLLIYVGTKILTGCMVDDFCILVVEGCKLMKIML